MAWGLFQNGQVIFAILTPIAIAAILFLYVRTPWEKEYRPIRIAEVMLIGGAIGNLIDRIFRFDPTDGKIFHGYVVDMIYVKAIKFPVFNVADMFVTVAFFLMIFLLIFVYNEDEFNKCFGNFPQKEKKISTEEGAEETRESTETESAETESTETKSTETESTETKSTETENTEAVSMEQNESAEKESSNQE